ncbi:MAG TPA: tRNA epoxyqueuosine(34) reductase QueG [Phycisphaerales bacterium]|nr:tRNA epoxyqueuosine(34) reductase QueG [Phycisphaerales bacterium]
MTTPARQLRDEVLEACRALGFALAGTCRARPSDWRGAINAWLAEGSFATMDWLEATMPVRLDIDRFLPGARSVVMVADQYAAPMDDVEETGSASTPSGRIARYARGRDYHKIVNRRLHRLADALRRLFPQDSFRCFVDAAPVLEREHAQRAGLGWIGRHTLLIHPQRGSYFVLAGLATTLDLGDSSDPETVANHCGTCTRCIDACPTGAIGSGGVDARRCISYLTIEHDGPIDAALQPRMDRWLLGCDVCQEVCPFNAPESGDAESSVARPVASHPAYRPAFPEPGERGGGALPLLELLGWTAADRATRLTSSAVKRATLDMLKRNALIALGNFPGAAESSDIVRRVREVADDEHEAAMVRQTARAVLARFEGRRRA